MLTILPAESVEAAVGASSTVIAYVGSTTAPIGVARAIFVSTVTCWIAQGATPVATAGSGSALIPAMTPVLVDFHFGAKIAVIDNGTTGFCSLTPTVQ